MSNNLAVATNQALNAVATPAPAHPWRAQVCDRYVDLMLDFAWWFLLGALIIGAIGAIVMVWNSLRLQTPPAEGGGGQFQQAVDAVRALIEALSKAPTWIAMLGGALLLLWMAGSAISACAGIAVFGNETGTNQTSNATGGNEANETATNGSGCNEVSTDEAGGGH